MGSAALQRTKTLVLPADLDGVAAVSLYEALTASVGTDLFVDGSHVERIGGLCLQILLSAANSWKVDGGELGLANPSLDLIEGLELLGICPSTFLDRELSR
jgi:chemotaxis protein CheX